MHRFNMQNNGWESKNAVFYSILHIWISTHTCSHVELKIQQFGSNNLASHTFHNIKKWAKKSNTIRHKEDPRHVEGYPIEHWRSWRENVPIYPSLCTA